MVIITTAVEIVNNLLSIAGGDCIIAVEAQMNNDETFFVNDDQKEQFHHVLMDWVADQETKTARRHLGDAALARKLDIPTSSLNRYLNKVAVPSWYNAVLLDQKIPGILVALGYPEVTMIKDSKAKYILRAWHKLDQEMRDLIYDHVREELGDKPADGQQPATPDTK